MKPFGNIHTQCAEDRRVQWQERNKSTIIGIGDFIQAGFSFFDNKGIETIEHLWFEVIFVRKERIACLLANDPISRRGPRCGDCVEFDFSKIEQRIPAAHMKPKKSI